MVNVGRKAYIIEIALSIYTLPQRPTFEQLFSGILVRPKAQKIMVGRKTVYEIDP